MIRFARSESVLGRCADSQHERDVVVGCFDSSAEPHRVPLTRFMEKLRIGLFGARHDNTGLGVQTKEFYDHIKPDKTLVVDISQLNERRGKISKLYPERFPDAAFIYGFPTFHDIDPFLQDLDIVFLIESPYSYEVLEMARARGIKTVLQFNYEFLDYFEHPDWVMPDCLASPTTWNIDIVKARFGHLAKVVHLPVPVNRERLPFRQRKEAKRFLHIAGHATVDSRNGTDVVLEAIDLVRNKEAEFVIYSQHSLRSPARFDVRVEEKDADNYWENYGNEDILLLPRKYGGLSLQLQEAMSKGMVPIMTNLPPQNTFLREESLIPTASVKTLYTRMDLPSHRADPKQLAERIDYLCEHPSLVEDLSNFSNERAAELSWEVMTPKYLQLFEEICDAGDY